MTASVTCIGLESRKGKALLATILPYVKDGVVVMNATQHRGLCEVLDTNYPLAGTQKHPGDFVFGLPVLVSCI